MCGRYTFKLSWEEIVTLYRLTLPEEPPDSKRRRVGGWAQGSMMAGARRRT